MSEPVIQISDPTRRFGAKTALAAVSLSFPRVSVRVFGLDPVAEPVAVLSRIGYLSEENDLPGWMFVARAGAGVVAAERT